MSVNSEIAFPPTVFVAFFDGLATVIGGRLITTGGGGGGGGGGALIVFGAFSRSSSVMSVMNLPPLPLYAPGAPPSVPPFVLPRVFVRESPTRERPPVTASIGTDTIFPAVSRICCPVSWTCSPTCCSTGFSGGAWPAPELVSGVVLSASGSLSVLGFPSPVSAA